MWCGSGLVPGSQQCRNCRCKPAGTRIRRFTQMVMLRGAPAVPIKPEPARACPGIPSACKAAVHCLAARIASPGIALQPRDSPHQVPCCSLPEAWAGHGGACDSTPIVAIMPAPLAALKPPAAMPAAVPLAHLGTGVAVRCSQALTSPTPFPDPAGPAMRVAVLLLALLAGVASGRRLAQIPAHLLNPGVTTHEVSWDLSKGRHHLAAAPAAALLLPCVPRRLRLLLHARTSLRGAARGSSCRREAAASTAKHLLPPPAGPHPARPSCHPPTSTPRSALLPPGCQVRRSAGLPLAGAPGGGPAPGRVRGGRAG